MFKAQNIHIVIGVKILLLLNDTYLYQNWYSMTGLKPTSKWNCITIGSFL